MECTEAMVALTTTCASTPFPRIAGTAIALSTRPGTPPRRVAARPRIEITHSEEAEQMKKAGVLLVLVVIAVVMTLAPVAWAADVEGKIKSVDPSGKMVTLADGTKLMIPPTVKVEKQALKPGANVKASYEEKDGNKVATSFMVMPAR